MSNDEDLHGQQMFFGRVAAYKTASLEWHEQWFYSPEQESFFEVYERQMDDALDGAYLLAEMMD